MTLEALLGHQERVSVHAPLEPFLHQSAAALGEIAAALSAHREPNALPPIRTAQRQLARELTGATEITDACDRLVDNINTLAYITARTPEQPPLMQPA